MVLKTDTPRSVDISGECCTLLECVMLAQAQEMCFELLAAKKATSSAIKWATLAQVAACAAELYTSAAEAYLKAALVRHVQREWGESNKAKALMYRAESHLLQVRLRCSVACFAEAALQRSWARAAQLAHATAPLQLYVIILTLTHCDTGRRAAARMSHCTIAFMAACASTRGELQCTWPSLHVLHHVVTASTVLKPAYCAK